MRNQRGPGSLIRRARARLFGRIGSRRKNISRRCVRTIVRCCALTLAAVVPQLLSTPALADPQVGLSLQPSHGPALDRVTALIEAGAGMALCVPGMQVVISWDGTPVRAVGLDAACSAVVRFRPPDGDSDPGQHVVRVQVNGTVQMFAAGYVIDAMGGAPGVDPMSLPSDGTDGSAMDPGTDPGADMADGGDMADPAPSPSPSPSSRAASDFVPIPSPAAATGGTLADPPRTDGGMPGGTWLFVFGGLLIGAGSAVLIQMVRNSRRRAQA